MKTLFVLASALLTLPAMATLQIDCENPGKKWSANIQISERPGKDFGVYFLELGAHENSAQFKAQISLASQNHSEFEKAPALVEILKDDSPAGYNTKVYSFNSAGQPQFQAEIFPLGPHDFEDSTVTVKFSDGETQNCLFQK